MKLTMPVLTALMITILTMCWATSALAEKPDDVSRLLSTNACSQCDLSGVSLSRASLKSAYLSRANLRGADLNQAYLKSADLSHANLQETQLYRADLSNSNLGGADLSDANLVEAIVSNADLGAANLSRADLHGARFSGFAGVANLSSANLSNANLQGTNLSNIRLVEANLSNVDLSNGASLRGALLNGADLAGAKLIGANLIEARLNNANLQGAKLSGANLSRANLTAADLTGADLTGINLTDAVLNEALGLDPYAENLLQQASSAATNQEFLTAIAYLKQVPTQTQIYAQAQAKITEYEEQQRIKEQQQKDTEANQLLQNAYNSAKSGNYGQALRFLRRIQADTEAYAKAQENIVAYAEKQRLKEEAERAAREKEIAEAQAKEAALGIGVTRNAIQSVFEQPEIGFTFNPKTPVNGQPQVLGTSKNKLAFIQLIGPSRNLRTASFVTILSDENFANLENSVFMLAFLKKALPDWEDTDDWLQSSAEIISQGTQREVVTTYGNQRIKLAFSKELRSLILSVEAKGQI
jgi:uncharacterized protein YjbI with pentapeptide repeats